jgi:hypothetical protein
MANYWADNLQICGGCIVAFVMINVQQNLMLTAVSGSSSFFEPAGSQRGFY